MGRSPNASLRSFVGFASCKTSVRTLSSILAWSQGASLSALRLIFKSSAFEPPDNKPGTDAGCVCQKALSKDAYKWSNRVSVRCTDHTRPQMQRCRAHQAYTTLQRGEGRQGCLKVSAKSASGRCATERSQRDREFVLFTKINTFSTS